MGHPGVKAQVTDNDIVDALIKNKGNVRAVARELKYSHNYIHERIVANPELVKVRDEARFQKDEEDLDKFEKVLHLAVENSDKDMTNALRSAFYYLNNRGKSRGYNLSNDPSFGAKDASSKLLKSLHNLAVAKDKTNE